MDQTSLMKFYQKPGISDPIQEKSITLVCVASVQSSIQFTAPTDRGDILGVQVFVGNSTLADLIGGNITISSNGTNVYEVVPLIKFSTLYQNDNNEFPFYLKSGGLAQVIVNNAAGTAITIAVNFLFRPPNNLF